MAARGGDGLPFMVSGRGIALAGLLAGLAFALFALAPGLDLAAARLFYAGDGRFVGTTPLGAGLRALFYYAPAAVLAGAAALWLAGRAGAVRRAPTGRALASLALGFALGPGLLVNVALKDHWHRPRPAQVQAFGGAAPFRPLGLPGGGCARNCSFVSGEEASAFWTAAPALMAPPPWRAAALAAALAFAAAAGLLRMAFGGHFLSDTVLAALFTWLALAASWRAVLGRRPPVRPVKDLLSMSGDGELR